MDTNTQPTIWEVPDDVWTCIEPILTELYPAKPKGHRRADLRPMLNGVIFRLRTGCQWNHLPKHVGDDSTVHRHFQNWCNLGVFERMWAILVDTCDNLGGSTGRGSRPTRRWARPVLGGPGRAQPPRTAGKRA
jgi:putative transposase